MGQAETGISPTPPMDDCLLKDFGVLDRLEMLIKAQSAGGKSVIDVLIELGCPIVSVAVIDAGEITARVMGSSKHEEANTTIPGSAKLKSFDDDTIFQACSISKSITALAVIKLCQEGTLHLDAPISQYLSPEQLSWIATPKTLSLVSQVSLRLLLSHTSGLCVHGFGGYPSGPIPSLHQILLGSSPANNDPIRPTLLPGQQFSYSGGGFTVVQLILETHLQKPFHQIMDETVLRPLKMTRSTYRCLSPDEKNYAPAYVTGKLVADPDHHTQPESAAAGLWTTPSDLLRAVRAVQQSLEDCGGCFLEKRWAEIMLMEVGENNGMGLGWFVKEGEATFSHPGGNDPGYRCFVAGYVDLGGRDNDHDAEEEDDGTQRWNRKAIPKDCGICVMTSSALGEVVLDKVMAALPYLKGWPSAISAPIVPFVDPGKKLDERAKGWCGNWGPGGKWSLVYDDGRFLVRYATFPPVPLVPGAIPAHECKAGTSIDMVADGLETMLRLGWKNGKQIIDVRQDGEVKTLERENGH
jgi:CubicO group peptidase (beta-lactamase class C family)